MKLKMAGSKWRMGLMALLCAIPLTGCPKKPPVVEPPVEPKPVELTVYSVRPYEGPTDKATSVTISGTGFKEGAKAFIGDNALTDLNLAGADSLKATVPSGIPAGTYNLIVRNTDGKEAVLQRGFKVVEAKAAQPTEPKPVECSLSAVYFDFDAASLTDEARATLQKDADCLKSKKATGIEVSGHTDERGSTDYNLALGQRRADEVKRYLGSLGLTNISTISYGEEKPADPESSEDAWGHNRRAEIMIK